VYQYRTVNGASRWAGAPLAESRGDPEFEKIVVAARENQASPR